MLKTNKENLVKWSVQGKIHHPLGGNYRITFDGKPMVLPATGGISYNVKIGDSAFNWVGDHVEPGVSIRNENTTENAALTTFACIGNEAKVVSGDAKGKKGYVTGMHNSLQTCAAAWGSRIHSACSMTRRCRISGVSPGSTSTAFWAMISPPSQISFT